MEYVFGTNDFAGVEVLKTKGDEHSNLTGFVEVVRNFEDCVITDRFFIVRKLDSKEDEAGKCYDWYEIDRHNRLIDKTGLVMDALEATQAGLEDAMCGQDAAVEERLTAIENALCELDKI